ncbi:putative pepsin [Drechslerella dactyloides]|uniref:Pepsin n=1 Tax=Drechslerella dactyloides TaxID=74499 RepID=A0AAD6IUI3_DREDA|nr:putative pepsin [Drechslerella dactyloides]
MSAASAAAAALGGSHSSSTGLVIKNPKHVADGTKAYVRLMNKYKFNPTLGGKYFQGKQLQQQGKFGPGLGGRARIVSRLQKKTGPEEDDIGLVTAEDYENDALWLAEVKIGTPPQSYWLDFDTSSADLWVWSTHLPKKTIAQANGKAVYNPTSSSTFTPKDGSTWNITYGDGSSASGTVGYDVLNLGGLSIPNQAVELANDLSESFIQTEGSGLLGLAFSSINTCKPEPVSTPVDTLYGQTTANPEERVFTCYLGSWRDKTDELDQGESFYTFGSISQPTVDRCGGKIFWTPIDPSYGWWMFKSATVTVGDHTPHRRSRNNSAIADTGTTLALLDDASCRYIYDQIPGAKYSRDYMGYIYSATLTEAQLPVVKIDIGGNSVTIQKEDLGFANAGNGWIYGGIQSRGDFPIDILGGTFLKAVYAIFDIDQKRFGFAVRPELKQNLATPPTDGQSSPSDDTSSKKNLLAKLLGKNKTLEKHAEL